MGMFYIDLWDQSRLPYLGELDVVSYYFVFLCHLKMNLQLIDIKSKDVYDFVNERSNLLGIFGEGVWRSDLYLLLFKFVFKT